MPIKTVGPGNGQEPLERLPTDPWLAEFYRLRQLSVQLADKAAGVETPSRVNITDNAHFEAFMMRRAKEVRERAVRELRKEHKPGEELKPGVVDERTGQIIENTIQAMIREGNCKPKDLDAASDDLRRYLKMAVEQESEKEERERQDLLRPARLARAAALELYHGFSDFSIHHSELTTPVEVKKYIQQQVEKIREQAVKERKAVVQLLTETVDKFVQLEGKETRRDFDAAKVEVLKIYEQETGVQPNRILEWLRQMNPLKPKT